MKNSPKDYHQFMAEHMMKQIERPIYCLVCGQDIKRPTQNSTRAGENGPWHTSWEIRHRMHMTCYQRKYGGMEYGFGHQKN